MEANYYGHYPYEIEGNYFDQDVLEVKPGIYRGELRVNRGGGWNDFANNLRSAYRASLTPSSSSPSVGFRVARNASAHEGTVGGAAATQAAGGFEPPLYA